MNSAAKHLENARDYLEDAFREIHRAYECLSGVEETAALAVKLELGGTLTRVRNLAAITGYVPREGWKRPEARPQGDLSLETP